MTERKTRIVRQLRNGQITIPKEFRDAMQLEPDDLLSVTLEDGYLSIKAARASEEQGSPWLKQLYDVFEPVRQSFLRDGMSEDEINAELDAAVQEAHAGQQKRRAAS